MNEPVFPLSLTLRLDWSELDMYGHINNVSYFKYLQASRVNYWEHAGMNSLHGTAGIGPMLASAQCDFKKPLYYPGNITVRASVVEMRHTSFAIRHQILDDAGAIAAEGRDIVVLFNHREGRKEKISAGLRQLIESLEGRVFPAAH